MTGAIQPSIHGFVQPIVERVRESALWVWKTVVIGTIAAGDRVSFVAFRILHWVRPSIAHPIEIVYLRVWRVIDGVRFGRKEEEVAALRRNVRSLQVEKKREALFIENYSPLYQEYQRLQKENQRLKQEGSVREGLQKLGGSLKGELEILEERGVAAQGKIEKLQQENRALLQEKEKFASQVVHWEQLLLEAKQVQMELQRQLTEQQEDGLSSVEMGELLARLPTREKGVAQSELDDILGSLLPLLVQQLANGEQSLLSAQRRFSENSVGGVALANVARVLKEIQRNLAKIPPAIERHRDWRNEVAILCGGVK